MAYYRSGFLIIEDVDKRTHKGLIAAFDRAEQMYILSRAESQQERDALALIKRIERDIAVCVGHVKSTLGSGDIYYRCPRCNSQEVWFDYYSMAMQNANTGEIEAIETGGERNGRITCVECLNVCDDGEMWTLTPDREEE